MPDVDHLIKALLAFPNVFPNHFQLAVRVEQIPLSVEIIYVVPTPVPRHGILR